MSGQPRPKQPRPPKPARGWNSTLPRGKGRLPGRSTKRQAEADRRDQVRRDALHRAGHRCQAKDLVPEVRCWGPLDVDEIEGRGVNPGGHLDPDNVQVLCRGHHDWKHAHPARAEELGLRRRSTYEARDDG